MCPKSKKTKLWTCIRTFQVQLKCNPVYIPLLWLMRSPGQWFSHWCLVMVYPALSKMTLISGTRLDECLIDDLFSPQCAAQWQRVCCSAQLGAVLGAATWWHKGSTPVCPALITLLLLSAFTQKRCTGDRADTFNHINQISWTTGLCSGSGPIKLFNLNRL